MYVPWAALPHHGAPASAPMKVQQELMRHTSIEATML
jgi:hypothetical protein